MCVYLRTKFQVSSIILTSFRQEVILTPPIAKRNPHKNGIKARRKEIKVYIMQGMELRIMVASDSSTFFSSIFQ